LCKIEQPQIANFALRKVLRSPQLGRIAAAITGAKKIQVWWVHGLIKPGVPGSNPLAPLAVACLS
jgi:hypothetical protein